MTEQEKPEPIHTHDASGEPVLETKEQTDAGVATHVEPDPEAASSADEDDEKKNLSDTASTAEGEQAEGFWLGDERA